MPRIFVLDEHSVYRIGLCKLLRTELPRAKVIDASNLSQLRNGGFDLVLAGTDRTGLEQLDSLKAAREVSPATRFAIVSASDTRADILATLSAGFYGFISKHQSDTEILAAVTSILAGRIYVPASFAKIKEIARTLAIAEATTKIHIAALLRALGVRNRTEAAFKAAKLVHSAELDLPVNVARLPKFTVQ